MVQFVNVLALLIAALVPASSDLPRIDTSAITATPEVLTYRTADDRGTGVLSMALSRRGGDVEAVVTIVAQGFSKTIWSTFDEALHPRRSRTLLVVAGKVWIETKIDYDDGTARIRTRIEPFGRDLDADLSFRGHLVDPALVPTLPGYLPLARGATFIFDSLDPQKNAVVPYRVEVVGETVLGNIPCFRVQVDSFEGRAIHIVEKGGRRRTLRIEQPAAKRVTDIQ